MQGFGQGLEQTSITTQLFRKCSFDNFLNEGELCFSTDKSKTLASTGEFCLVLENSEYSGMYVDGDADAGKNFGYDEFRVELTREELLSAIDYIVVPNEWVDSDLDFEAADYIAEEDPYEWVESLSEYGRVIAERDFENMNFNF